MSSHVSEWLNAYHDGELRGIRLQQVEAHLAECQVCQAEHESLKKLSGALSEVPVPRFTRPEQFARQVNLRLPQSRKGISRKKFLEIGWWMIPIGLAATWIFFTTVFVVRDLISAANNMGLLSSISTLPILNSSVEPFWSSAFARFGLLNGNSLSWAEATEVFTRTSLPLISLQVSIALLYLGWIAIWWTRNTRQGYGQLREG